MCRSGFYEYEHIDPEFKDSHAHDPEFICCLCSSCHSSVTRGQRSKASVAVAYKNIQSRTIEEVGKPEGPLDFHDGNAKLSIGGLNYSPLVKTVLRYHNTDIIKVNPGDGYTPGTISATFTDHLGNPTLYLIDNAWQGSTENWDIEIIGRCITVRSQSGLIPLKLRLDPPGKIVIESLDMRVGSSHLLVSEHSYAAGRYLSDDSIAWITAQLSITRTSEDAVAIEFSNPEDLRVRDETNARHGQRLVTQNGNTIISSGAGCMWIPYGISVASLCGGFNLYGLALGIRSIDGMRRMVKKGPQSLMRYLGSG